MTTAQATAKRSIMTPRGAILVLLLAGVLFSSVYPVRRYFAVKHSIAQLHQQKQALIDRQAVLRKESDLLSSDAEVERLAREYGMVRPGEVPFAVVAPQQATAQQPTVSADGGLPAEQPSHPGLFSRIWDRIIRAAHTIG
jgi:cell division protein FtsB